MALFTPGKILRCAQDDMGKNRMAGINRMTGISRMTGVKQDDRDKQDDRGNRMTGVTG